MKTQMKMRLFTTLPLSESEKDEILKTVQDFFPIESPVFDDFSLTYLLIGPWSNKGILDLSDKLFELLLLKGHCVEYFLHTPHQLLVLQ